MPNGGIRRGAAAALAPLLAFGTACVSVGPASFGSEPAPAFLAIAAPPAPDAPLARPAAETHTGPAESPGGAAAGNLEGRANTGHDPARAGVAGGDSAASGVGAGHPRGADTAAAIVPPPAPTWDLEVEANAARTRVAYFVDAFSGRLREPFQKALARQSEFAPLIEARLRAAGLPLDLTYLAFVESYYDPQAYSRAAAVGMWQFMTRTAQGVGLRVDWWVDERRDPVRSTEGAVRLLASLNDEFGSPFLAAAAYNGGSGRVSRGLAQFAARLEGVEGEDRFFALSDTRYLRAETRDYIPKIIAAALVAKQPDRYGLTVDSLPAFVFDSVLVPGGTPLAAVAAAAPTPTDSVRDLNPHVLRGMVPEGDSMWVRVPVGAADGFADRFGALDSAARAGLTRVKSKKGESMASIARRHGITSKQLGWFNPKAARLKSGNLVTGQTIVVPSATVVAAARDVPNPAIERYPRRARSTTTARPAAKAPAKTSAATKRP